MSEYRKGLVASNPVVARGLSEYDGRRKVGCPSRFPVLRSSFPLISLFCFGISLVDFFL
jgi:hypothetical protein